MLVESVVLSIALLVDDVVRQFWSCLRDSGRKEGSTFVVSARENAQRRQCTMSFADCLNAFAAMRKGEYGVMITFVDRELSRLS